MIKWAEDLGIPALVAVADYGTERYDEDRVGTASNPIVGIVMAAAGYGLTAFGMGGDYTKNLGIASLNWAVRGVRRLIAERGITMGRSTSSRLVMRKKIAASERAITPGPTTLPEEIIFSVT